MQFRLDSIRPEVPESLLEDNFGRFSTQNKMYFGLYDWLSHPTPGSRCVCHLNVKKCILLIVIFFLLIALGMGQYLFIEKFYLIIPPMSHAILLLIELTSFVLFVYALYSERAVLFLPFLITQAIRLVSLFAVIVFYIYRLFTIENSPPTVHIPALQYDDYHKTKAFFASLIGHEIMIFFCHLVLFYISFACYRMYSSTPSRRPQKEYEIARPVHSMIILQQPIEEAMYGKKPNH